MTTAVLLLNADFSPIKVIPWEKAIWLIISEKAMLVADYAGRLIRSQSMEMEFPAVVALKKYVRNDQKVRMNRANILGRDGYTCQYCGIRPKTPTGRPLLSELTLDHVVPRAKSHDGRVTLPWNGKNVPVTHWENLATACADCNGIKAARTPDEAGMKLMRYPTRPSTWDAIRMALSRSAIPDEWEPFIPEAWSGYWTVELESD